MTVESKPVVQQWARLRPATAPQFEDPYARLHPTQVKQLALLARIGWLLDTGRDTPDGASAREGTRIRRALAAEGLDADRLLSQREAVRRHRLQQSYNPAVDGLCVKLMGLVLPLAWDADNQFTQFLLAPEWGRCSHEPAPPRHQVIRVESPMPLSMDHLPCGRYRGVSELCLWVEGTLRVSASTHTIYRGDGMVRAESSYVIEPAAMTHPSPAELAALLKGP